MYNCPYKFNEICILSYVRFLFIQQFVVRIWISTGFIESIKFCFPVYPCKIMPFSRNRIQSIKIKVNNCFNDDNYLFMLNNVFNYFYLYCQRKFKINKSNKTSVGKTGILKFKSNINHRSRTSKMQFPLLYKFEKMFFNLFIFEIISEIILNTIVLRMIYEAFHVNCPSARRASPKSYYF